MNSSVQDDIDLTPEPDHFQPSPAKPACSRPGSIRCRLGLREHLALVLVTVALLPLLTLYWAERHQIRSDTLDLTYQTLNLIADVQQRRIDLELQRLQDMTRLVSSRTQMRLSLAAYARDGDRVHLDLVERILADAIGAMPDLLGIWIRDPAGRILVQMADDAVPVQAFEPADIPTTDPAPILFRVLETQEPDIWLNAPLVLDQTVIGSIHLLVRMRNIRSLLEDFDDQSPGGETLLLLGGDGHATFAWSACTGVRNLETAPSTPLNDLLRDVSRRIHEAAPSDAPAIATPGSFIHTERRLALEGAHILVHTHAFNIQLSERKQLNLLLSVTFSLIVLALIAALILARVIADPIHELMDGMHRLSRGDYHARIREHGWAELSRLTRAFNETADSLQHAIQARLRSERELATLANTDALTGLNNRRRFMEILTQHVERTDRNASGGALIYLDLDGFKPVNDQYGHDAGDAVLRIVAERLRYVVREQDQIGRLGGDEFAILLHRLEADFEPEAVSRRINETLSQPMTIQGRQIRIDCSLGLVHITPDSRPSDLLKVADAAMYRAKADKPGRP